MPTRRQTTTTEQDLANVPSAASTPAATRRPRRGRLDRETVLRAALHLVEERGIDALTMRAVASELGVDPMTLYRHVANKDAMLDGIVELLWSQVPPPPEESGDWQEVLRQLGQGLRNVMLDHPESSALMLSRPVMPRSALEFLKRAMDVVQEAGFDERRAAAIVRCVSTVAMSDSALHLGHGHRHGAPGPNAMSEEGQPHGEGEPSPEQWISIAQLLPPDTPPDLVRVAWAVCPPMEASADLDLAIELLVAGAQHLRDTDRRRSPRR